MWISFNENYIDKVFLLKKEYKKKKYFRNGYRSSKKRLEMSMYSANNVKNFPNNRKLNNRIDDENEKKTTTKKPIHKNL